MKKTFLMIAAFAALVFSVSAQGRNQTGKGKTLVVYYSATGTTERIARFIADATGGDLFEIEPADPYTDDDLDWTDKNSRVNREHENPNRHVALKNPTPPDFDSYDTIYVGGPHWWRVASWVLDDFLKLNDFDGKTMIPFCTSMSTPYGDTGKAMEQTAGSGRWIEGRRFSSRTSRNEVTEWVNSLK